MAIVVALMAATACDPRKQLSAPAPTIVFELTKALRGATAVVPVAKGTTVVAIIYEFPVGASDASLEVRPIRNGDLPARASRRPLTGAEAFNKPGSYVAIAKWDKDPSKIQLRYITRISDPRYVRAEWSNPTGATLVKLASGATSVRVPFLPDATVIGFEVDHPQHIANVHYRLDLGAAPPQKGISYRVRR